MSVKKLGIILFSSFLIFALAPVIPAAQSPTYEKTMPHKGTTEKHSAMKDAGKDTGLSKERVREIQTALKDAGFDPGPIDGVIGPRTTKAIRDFQFDTGILATGKIDNDTLVTLEVEEAGTAVAMTQPAQEQRLSESEFERIERESELGQSEIHEGELATEETEAALLTNSEFHDDIKVGREKPSVAKPADKEHKDVMERVQKAADVLRDLTRAEDKRIPNELLERAEAIAVIPNMLKGAFGIGGRYGKGVVSKRLDNGRWSPPAFIEVGGGSFGAQIGISSTDLVLVFTDKRGLDLLEGGRELKLGVDASVAAGPIGRSAEAGVTGKLESGVYAYSRSKGLFAGIALDGAVLDTDNSANRKIYGESAMTDKILSGSMGTKSTVKPFMDSLERAVPKKKISQR